MTNDPESLRSVIDEIALKVAEIDTHHRLERAIADLAIRYMTGASRGTMSEAELDRITKSIIKGVLQRLEQIAIGGGQIGSA